MKTTVTLDAVNANLNIARNMEREARALRDKASEMRKAVSLEEEKILQDMVELLCNAPHPLTAREVSSLMNEVMSVHEVAGQLSWTYMSADTGRRDNPRYRQHHMAHVTMAKVAPRVVVKEKDVTRRFAEVDETGAVLPGGRTFKLTESRNVYSVKR